MEARKAARAVVAKAAVREAAATGMTAAVEVGSEAVAREEGREGLGLVSGRVGVMRAAVTAEATKMAVRPVVVRAVVARWLPPLRWRPRPAGCVSVLSLSL